MHIIRYSWYQEEHLGIKQQIASQEVTSNLCQDVDMHVMTMVTRHSNEKFNRISNLQYITGKKPS